MDNEAILFVTYVAILWLKIVSTSLNLSIDGIYSLGWNFALVVMPILIFWGTSTSTTKNNGSDNLVARKWK